MFRLLLPALALLLASGLAHATVFTVDNTHVDLGDLHPGDGKCEFATFVPPDQRCTLRAAIDEANVDAGTDSIIVPAGTEIDLDKGALEIFDAVTIGTNIADSAHAVIKSDGSDRVLYVINYGDVTLQRLDITNGSAPSNNPLGGGIYFTGDGTGKLQLNFCALYGNAAGSGGAIFSHHSLGLSHVEIRGNVATGNGGAMVAFDPCDGSNVTLAIRESSIHNNLTFRSGDGIERSSMQLGPMASVGIENTTISTNLPYGISITDTPVTLRNDTITGSSDVGLTFFNSTSTLLQVKLFNSIIAGNGSDCDFSGSTESTIAYNLYGENSCPGGFAPNQFNTNPKLAPLAPRGNGLPLHELTAGSPAIDAGDPGNPGTCTDQDQDGRGRGNPFNAFPATTGLVCDVGAAEFDDLIFRNGFE